MTNLANAGPAARTLGLNLGELTNLFSKFEEGGINGSRAQQALNNAAKVFADANIPLKTGLADTITQIHGFIEAGNEAAAVDLAGKVFGGRGAEQFVDLIRQGKLTARRTDHRARRHVRGHRQHGQPDPRLVGELGPAEEPGHRSGRHRRRPCSTRSTAPSASSTT